MPRKILFFLLFALLATSEQSYAAEESTASGVASEAVVGSGDGEAVISSMADSGVPEKEEGEEVMEIEESQLEFPSSGTEAESDDEESVYVDPTDVCTFTPEQFFTESFEGLVELVYPGEGFTGEEPIYCGDYEDDNPELLAELKMADTDEDEELNQVEFDVWKEEKGYVVEEQ